MAWNSKKEEENERFDPAHEQDAGKGSTAKRVAIFIFIAAGALFTIVAFTIMNSSDIVSGSSAPQEIIEASRGAALFIPPPPREPTPTPTPERHPTTEPEPESEQGQQQPAPTPTPQVRRSVRPAYLPAPGGDRSSRVTDSRRQNQAQRMQAASSPTAIQGFGRQGQNGAGADASPLLAGATGTFPAAADMTAQQGAAGAMALTQGTDITQGGDPNGWGRKEAFRQQALPAEYSQHTRAFPVSAFELKAGTLLPCVLISGLNSDLPGNLIAQVSENVWDTATGRLLLIPRGSRLMGTYDHQIAYGQNRALVIWSRLIFPDGSSLLLDNLQGMDQSGYSGFKGKVDRHLGQLITSALMVSLMGAGVELATNNNNNNNNNNSRKSAGDILSERVVTSIAQAMSEIINKSINRQPTIVVKPGYRFMIFVQHDIVFPRAWSASQGR